MAKVAKGSVVFVLVVFVIVVGAVIASDPPPANRRNVCRDITSVALVNGKVSLNRHNSKIVLKFKCNSGFKLVNGDEKVT